MRGRKVSLLAKLSAYFSCEGVVSSSRYLILYYLATRARASVNELRSSGLPSVGYHLPRLTGLVKQSNGFVELTLCGRLVLFYYCSRRGLPPPPVGARLLYQVLSRQVMLLAASVSTHLASWLFSGVGLVVASPSPLPGPASLAASIAIITLSLLVAGARCCLPLILSVELLAPLPSVLNPLAGSGLYVATALMARALLAGGGAARVLPSVLMAYLGGVVVSFLSYPRL